LHTENKNTVEGETKKNSSMPVPFPSFPLLAPLVFLPSLPYCPPAFLPYPPALLLFLPSFFLLLLIPLLL
jgi:hypothetical protein